MGTVARRISSRWMPVMAQGRIGLASGTVGMPRRRTRVGQRKLASDPESRRTVTWSWVLPQEIRAETPGLDALGADESVTPVRIPSLTDGHSLFTGHVERTCPASPQYRHRWWSWWRCRSGPESLVLPTCMGSGSGPGRVARGGALLWAQGLSRDQSGSRRRREARWSATRASTHRVSSTSPSREVGRSQVFSSSRRRSDRPLKYAPWSALSPQPAEAARVRNLMA